jgi:RND superfamily putative drug exporter
VFTRLGHLTVRRRRLVLALSGIFVVLAAVLGGSVFSRLDAGGFADPDAESTRATDLVVEEFRSGQPNLVLLVDAADGDVDSPATSAAGAEVLARLKADPAVVQAVSYWSFGNAPPLRSTDGDTAVVLARIDGDDNELVEAVERIEEDMAAMEASEPAIEVSLAGEMPANEAANSTIEGDLARAESVAVPITLVLLVLVFAGLVAAGLPLMIGVMAVLGTFVTLWAISLFTDVSVFSINLVTALGLGLAIDYSLFIVSRFREELARRPRAEWAKHDRAAVEDAIVRTVETAGRTVAFSALTVGVSLAALLVFPMYFLRSFAYAGIGVTLVAMASSLLTLPAVLATLGRRIDALSLPSAQRRATEREANPTRGFWYRTAMFAQRRAVVVAPVVVALLVLLGLPFLKVAFGTPDERVLPADDPARVATERLRQEFDSSEADAFPVVVEGTVGDAELDRFAVELSTLEGVTRVDAPTGRYMEGTMVLPGDDLLARQRTDDAFYLNVVPEMTPISAEGERLVEDIRAVDAPGERMLVGGSSAEYHDMKDTIAARLPWALGLIALTTFVLLFLMFGSVVVPLKAIVLNVLSLSATFGAMVWVFQWGHGAELLDFTPTGLTDLTTPILMFCIAFGLSMDYEVFLLSRIAEEHHRGADNTAAVAMGLQRTGRIVTAAAALLAVTFLAFATSGISFIKLFGLGLALAVLMDATVVRALLVPAFMRLAGDANWWAPGWMRRIHDRIGLSEGDDGVSASVRTAVVISTDAGSDAGSDADSGAPDAAQAGAKACCDDDADGELVGTRG